MSSREMAELVEKRHDNVKRTIETLIERGVIASPQIEEKPTAGRPSTEYVFSGERGKRDSIIVVAQFCTEFTSCLVDRSQGYPRCGFPEIIGDDLGAGCGAATPSGVVMRSSGGTSGKPHNVRTKCNIA